MGDNSKRAVDAYTVDANGCWLWQGRRTWKGYGCIGSESNRAHRIYFQRFVGSIPSGMQVLHRCDVKHCVNPKHLYLGTHADNMKDASNRGQLHSPARRAALLENMVFARAKSAEVRRAAVVTNHLSKLQWVFGYKLTRQEVK